MSSGSQGRSSASSGRTRFVKFFVPPIFNRRTKLQKILRPCSPHRHITFHETKNFKLAGGGIKGSVALALRSILSIKC